MAIMLSMTREELSQYYSKAQNHKAQHQCGAVPFDNGSLLAKIVNDSNAKKILEVGTGIGYSTAALLSGNKDAYVVTIDKDKEHLSLAVREWERLDITSRIKIIVGKVEDILPTFSDTYDLIFYDGFVPQKKLVLPFYSLLKPQGILITANLFLAQPDGGRYVTFLKDQNKWKTAFFKDTAVSQKVLTQK